MTTVKVKIGVIGAGEIANQVHYPSLNKIPEVAMNALCDVNETKLINTANRFNIKRYYQDYRQMLEEVDLDAVYVILPPQNLMEVVNDCFKAGKHVFMEKPPGLDSQQTKTMRDEALRNQRIGMVGFNRPFCPVLQAAYQQVIAKGPITQCVGEFHKNLGQPPYYGLSFLWADIMHIVHALNWMGGSVREVHPYIDRFFTDWDNGYNVLFRFDSGGVGVLMANRGGGCRYERFEIHGKGISAYITTPDQAEIYRDGNLEPEILTAQSLTGSNELWKTYGYFQENQHFIHCILSRETPLFSLDNAYEVAKLCETIEDKADRTKIL